MTAEEAHKAKLIGAFRRFLDGWGMKADDNAAERFAEGATSGDMITSTTFLIPRDTPAEYRAGKIRAERARLLAEIDRAGCFPAGPLAQTSVHRSFSMGPHIEVPPEIDEWDHEEIHLECWIWDLTK